MQHLSAFVMVFLGGGFGSLLRFGLGLLIKPGPGRFPWSTLVANTVACLILGAVIGLYMNGQITDQRRLLLGTGLCGGLSTFSTFIAENWAFYENGQTALMLANTLLSFLFCFTALIIGLKTAV